jgi:5-methylcytosine-specific restriction endonuclease McrA
LSALVSASCAESQLAFLTKLQRLFAEGDFTATYKFALLIALADLAVDNGADDGAELLLSNRQIAERFIHLYWRHASPYSTSLAGATPGILVQNLGTQATVLSAIAEFRARTGAGSPQQAKRVPGYADLLGAVARTVSAQPLNYLQNFGGMTDPFLYERDGRGNIRLQPGVAYCFRRFYPLVQQLSRAHWVGHIKSNRRNHPILGDAGDLEDFLFSTSRQSLAVIGENLRKLDGCSCFYCGRTLDDADVDHYIPFSLYPRDLAHNFVLAHPACNRSKSDALAGMPHLERWLERLLRHADDLAAIGASAGMTADDQAVAHVAAWAYGNANASGAQAWLATGRYEAVNDDYLGLLAIAQR